DSNRKDRLSRRDLLGAASLAGLGAAMLPVSTARAQAHQTYQVGKDPGKHEPIPDFKFDIEAQTGWVGEAGSAKEATVEEFPPSQNIAGVSMRLKPGGIRELHWHAIAAEWAFVISGRILTTVIAPNGEPATDIFDPGDIWYFPKGHGHALQNISNEEAHFVLGFDDGNFSEFGTFSITDWIGHTPPQVLARNLGLPQPVFASMAKAEAYIIPGKVPPAVPEGLRNGNPNENQFPHKFRLGAMQPRKFPGGEERIVSSLEFPIQTTLTGVIQDLKPGGLREM